MSNTKKGEGRKEKGKLKRKKEKGKLKNAKEH